MYSINNEYQLKGDYIDRKQHTADQTATNPSWKPYRWLSVSTTDSGGKSTIAIDVLNGLEILRDDSREMLDYDGTAILHVDDQTVEIEITDGTTTREIDTEEPVEVQAIDLKDHPAEPSETVVVEP